MRKHLSTTVTLICFIASLYTGNKVRNKYIKGI
jgi:hypothetical protein